jgi:drug/metabolite transporter (DMT)-like permease
VAFYRTALATLLLAPAAFGGNVRQLVSISGRDAALLTLAGLCLAGHFGAWISSLEYIPIAASVVLVNTHPALVVVASWLILGERPGTRSLAGLAVGLIGALITCREGLLGVRLAVVGQGLALLGAVAMVGYFIIGRTLRRRLGLFTYAAPLYLISSIFLLTWVAATGKRLHPYGGIEWLYFAALAVVPTILGHTVFNWALKHVSASAVSIACLGEPVVATILALLIFGQYPPASTLVGGVLVLVGIYLSVTGEQPND